MTPKQEKHLSSIKKKFASLVDVKYRAGAKEHGGNLQNMGQMDLLDQAIFECLDQFTYLMTLREKLNGR